MIVNNNKKIDRTENQHSQTYNTYYLRVPAGSMDQGWIIMKNGSGRGALWRKGTLSVESVFHCMVQECSSELGTAGADEAVAGAGVWSCMHVR